MFMQYATTSFSIFYSPIMITMQDPTACSGIYESPVIQEIINVMWFANKRDKGVVYGSYFKSGIPIVTIALVLTVVCYFLSNLLTNTYG